ncbi:subtilisin-like protease [Rutidosis leptorrhynchoides]|uniref:subtilisin-like protease n=1 Tax=Rutidosis leptorrhynchoides TaxID=125765 RepID=UPI003A9A1E52
MVLTISFMLSLTCTTIFTIFPIEAEADELKTYIVHLTSPEEHEFSHPNDFEERYISFLSRINYSTEHQPKMVHAYHHVLTGFAAKMLPNQAKYIENLSEVLSVRVEDVYELHTTHSPHFLGLQQSSGLWKDSNYGIGTIIGVLDTGITPNHPSFNDKGVPPPPIRWKGKCDVAMCNNKLIGLRSFVKGSSPIDEVGHGTHTSATAAGNFVGNASIFGNANGTAVGTAPFAHVAHYKVCDGTSCSASNIYAGMDSAIGDGVDVLSLSFGGGSVPFHEDALAISAFTAIQKGIFVTSSVGNLGPFRSKLSNEFPWTLSVGASTTDRKIRTTVFLGNKKRLDGESLYQPKGFRQKLTPLVYPGEKGDNNAAMCIRGSLDDLDVKGKLVLCDMGGLIGNIEKGEVVKDAGGAGMILANTVSCPESTVPEAHVLPASNVGFKEGLEIKRYWNSTSSPLGTIVLSGTVFGVKSAPEVACFSSRGPSIASPGILKPDIIGPGVDILAAWPNSVDKNSQTKATFNFQSGTSMSCPHLAGIAALLKSSHPEWSPAAIKSAIMTTASRTNLNGKPILDEREVPADVFATGAGHVNPLKANDPGLVYDIQPDDYIPYLCGLGYTNEQIKTIVKKDFSCIKSIPEAELNYPSIVVTLKGGENKMYSRTVTNVGQPKSTYTIASVSLPTGVRMVFYVPFQGVRFTSMNQKLTYKVKFSRNLMDQLKEYGQGYMTLVSGKYSVTTTFCFKFE